MAFELVVDEHLLALKLRPSGPDKIEELANLVREAAQTDVLQFEEVGPMGARRGWMFKIECLLRRL